MYTILPNPPKYLILYYEKKNGKHDIFFKKIRIKVHFFRFYSESLYNFAIQKENN